MSAPRFPLPMIAMVDVRYQDARVEFLIDAETFFTWDGKISRMTPPWARAELVGWIAIQRERKRLGMPYLTLFEPLRAPSSSHAEAASRPSRS